MASGLGIGSCYIVRYLKAIVLCCLTLGHFVLLRLIITDYRSGNGLLVRLKTFKGH